jgi:hypothetical protein
MGPMFFFPFLSLHFVQAMSKAKQTFSLFLFSCATCQSATKIGIVRTASGAFFNSSVSEDTNHNVQLKIHLELIYTLQVSLAQDKLSILKIIQASRGTKISFQKWNLSGLFVASSTYDFNLTSFHWMKDELPSKFNFCIWQSRAVHFKSSVLRKLTDH